MSMADRIPTLDDKALETLHANAVRLEGSGAPAQQKAAAEMLPLITAELEARQARKPKPVKKPRAKKAAASEGDALIEPPTSEVAEDQPQTRKTATKKTGAQAGSETAPAKKPAAKKTAPKGDKQ